MANMAALRGRPIIIWGGGGVVRIFANEILFFGEPLIRIFFFSEGLRTNFFFPSWTTPPQMINGRPLNQTSDLFLSASNLCSSHFLIFSYMFFSRMSLSIISAMTPSPEENISKKYMMCHPEKNPSNWTITIHYFNYTQSINVLRPGRESNPGHRIQRQESLLPLFCGFTLDF